MSAQQEITSDDASYHLPVLLQETIELLAIRENGIYVDCTFGGGGHARAILNQLGPSGRLIAFDQDADARQNAPDDSRLLFIPQNFRHLHRFLRLHEIDAVDGILADLGVSSHQFDEASRGFSYRFDAPMDMRMDQRQAKKATDILLGFSEQQLHKLFEQYGEVTNARTLARTIVAHRSRMPMDTIHQFRQAVQEIVKGNPNKYFAQVFQALRMEVNDELGALQELLEQSVRVLKPGGRVAIITFHSLEDRMVKQFFKTGTTDTPETDTLFGGTAPSPFELVNKKPVVAGANELKKNGRSRSAKLRVARKK